jgi:hypothetical protein
MEKPNNGHRRLLRLRRERHCRRAAEQRDELAPLHSVELHLPPQAWITMAAYRIGEDQVWGSLGCGISPRLWAGLGQNPNPSSALAYPIPPGADMVGSGTSLPACPPCGATIL